MRIVALIARVATVVAVVLAPRVQASPAEAGGGPDDPDLSAAYAALADKRFAAAIQGFAAAVKADPAALPSAWGWGMALYGKGDLDGALTIFERILKTWPNHGRALYGRGLIRLRRGGAAEADLRAALAVDVDDVRARFRLGQALAARSAYEEACLELRAVLRRRWIHQPARHALVLALRDSGRLADAEAEAKTFSAVDRLIPLIRRVERRVRANPEDSVAVRELMELYVRAGRRP